MKAARSGRRPDGEDPFVTALPFEVQVKVTSELVNTEAGTGLKSSGVKSAAVY